MLKTTGLFVISAFRVDDDEVIGGIDGAGAGGNIVKRKVGSIVHNQLEYPEDEENVHPSLKPQRAGSITEEAPIKVPVEYADFVDVFSSDLVSGLLEYTRINDRAIKLVDVNEFIRPSKSPAGAPIFFDWESNGSLWMCVNYRNLNNLTIAMSVLMASTVTIARTVIIAITSLTLLDKLGKV